MEWLQTDAAMQLLKTLGLLIFVAVFSGVLLWVVARKRSEVNRWSSLPFDDDPNKQ